MSSGPGALSRHKHLEEFSTPLVTNEGVLSPEDRIELVRANLGIPAVAAPAEFSAAYSQAELNAFRDALIAAGVLTE